MDGRIARLRNHYRIHGGHAQAPDLALRLDRVVRERVSECYEAALQQAMPDDKAVYVLRYVRARVSLLVGERATDKSLATSWGFNLARSVVRAIAEGKNDGNLVRFEDQADYVAQFLVSRLRGNHHTPWFFEGFVEFFDLDSRAAINQTLLANSEHLPAILSYVQREGELDALIASLDVSTRQALWSRDLAPLFDPEASRSLFSTAIQLADRIVAGTGRHDTEDLFHEYVATAPAIADWQDTTSLAEGVFDVLQFLFARGYLQTAFWQDATSSSQLSEVLSDFGWLNTEWLIAAIHRLVNTDAAKVADLPVRSASGRATPRQKELLSTLAKSLNQFALNSTRDRDLTSDALRLFARLATDSPHQADTAAKVMIENILAVRAVLPALPARAEFVRRLKSGDAAGALSLLPPGTSESVTRACRYLAALGEQATEVLDTVCGVSETKTLAPGFRSESAGLALLLRGIVDSRLSLPMPNLPQPIQWPSPAMLFLSMAVRLGGEQAVRAATVDAGLCLLAGLKQKARLEDIAALWSDVPVCASLQTAVLRIAAGQRIVQPEVMHVFWVEIETGTRALIAGDASACVWPLGRIVHTKSETKAVVLAWLDEWEEATGIRPRVFLGDATVRRVIARGSKPELMARTDKLQAAHEAGEIALRAAFEILQAGKLGKPDVDLTLAILACMTLRMWARWLRGFSSSTIPFLLENFVRRSGSFQVVPDGLIVELERRSLDVALEMAGYLADLEHVPWLNGGRVKFLLRGN